MGVKSLPIAVLAGAATGAVLSMEMRDSLVRFGGKSLVPAIIVFSLIKETGPMITALVLTGRVGAGIGAELETRINIVCSPRLGQWLSASISRRTLKWTTLS